MWLFVYGSLMWDGWEKAYPCTRRSIAQLSGYARSFDKPSVKRWGSTSDPCPTLSLSPVPIGICRGIAFEFPDSSRSELLDILSKREGNGFEFPDLIIQLLDGTEVTAAIPMLREGARRLEESIQRRVALVGRAVGDAGSCYEYVAGIVESLAKVGIEDSAVTEFWEALSRGHEKR